MLTSRLLRVRTFATTAAGSKTSASTSSGGESPLYRYVLRDNRAYFTFIVIGGAVVGGAYSAAGDFLWKSVNRGRLYDDIDWSKWDSKWKS